MNIPFERSFASHPKSKFWSDKNELKPHEVYKSNREKYWFICDKCSHKFEIGLDKILYRNQWCSYCSCTRLCENEKCEICFNKSFASHSKSKFWSKNNELKPRDVFKSSSNKFWFNCDKCLHTFDCSTGNVNNNYWCPYCSNQKLCKNEECKDCFDKSFASQTKSKFWSNKNKLSPRQIHKCSSKKIFFICNKCYNEFDCSLANVINNSWCPYCINKSEGKLFYWLKKQTYLDVKPQVIFNWCKKQKKLPFDFLLKDFNIIIELDGPQHFKQVSNWQSPEKTQENDEFKNKSALENGYHMIRISQEIVLADKEDWENKLKEAINTCIKSDETLYLTIGEVYNI
jgi:very-short-patch-repair endonuclease